MAANLPRHESEAAPRVAVQTKTEKTEVTPLSRKEILARLSLIMFVVLFCGMTYLLSQEYDDDSRQEGTIRALNATLGAITQEDLDKATATAIAMMTQTSQAEMLTTPSRTPSPSATATLTPSPTRFPSLNEYLDVDASIDESPYLANGQSRLQEMSFPAWVQANLDAMQLDPEDALAQNRLFRWLYQPPTENGQPTDVNLGLYNPEYDELNPETTGLNFQDADPQAIENGAAALRSNITQVTLPNGEMVWVLDVDQIEAGVGLVEANPEGDGLFRTFAKAEDLAHLQYIMIESIAGIILEADHRNGGNMSPAEALGEASVISQNITNQHWDQNLYEPLMVFDENNDVVESGNSIDAPPARTCRIQVEVDTQPSNGDGERADQELELLQVPLVEVIEIEMPFPQLAANDPQAFALVVNMEAIAAEWNTTTDRRGLIQGNIQVELFNMVKRYMTGIPENYDLSHQIS